MEQEARFIDILSWGRKSFLARYANGREKTVKIFIGNELASGIFSLESINILIAGVANNVPKKYAGFDLSCFCMELSIH